MRRAIGTTGHHVYEDGYTFDSITELRVYRDHKLELMAIDHPITQLVVHPKFEIIPAYICDGEKVRATIFTLDFSYYMADPSTHQPMGKLIVEDVKAWALNKRTGRQEPITTGDWEIKWRLIKYQHPEIIFKII